MNKGQKYTEEFPTIYYKTFGNKDNPCIILIMGLGGQLIHWPKELLQGLSNNGFYVVIFDNRDVGLSQRYDHFVNNQQCSEPLPPYTLEDMAKDVIILMDRLQIKNANIVGLSLGGMVAQIISILYPKRSLSLICIATSSSDPGLPPIKQEVLEYLSSPQRLTEGLEEYLTNKIQMYKVSNHPKNIPSDDVLRTIYIDTYKRSHYPLGLQRQLLSMICAESRGDKLKKLQIPSLIIHGDYDIVFPIEHAKQLANCLPNCRLEIIPDLGHGLPVRLCDLIREFCMSC